MSENLSVSAGRPKTVMPGNMAQDNRDIQTAREVLTKEAEALVNLGRSLNESFVQAIDIVRRITGRVIVSGMGKSGHVGAKLAATFASTGTPAFFVHPGEASHGDLGMITPNDVVLAISHSGETRELGDLIAYCARFSVPLIAMTGKKASSLAKAADCVLLNGVNEEACPLNLAPTTSTTAFLALGDALAIALMARRDFMPDDFARFHPGGRLGAQLVKVGELMAKGIDLPLITDNADMQQALIEMSAKGLGMVGVTHGGKLVGVMTDGDLRRHMSDDLMSRRVGEIMSGEPLTIRPNALASAAVALMQKNKKGRNITALFVTDENDVPQGVLHIHHCLRAGVI